ncbi:cellulase family glycosylhydrolase [Scopulibacillus darangshiensis]
MPFNGPRPTDTFLSLFQDHESYTIVNADRLDYLLDHTHVDVFINLQGPYFPKQSWTKIVKCLAAGSAWIHTGGAPFRIPCYEENGEWVMEREQTAYHQTLNIHEALPVSSEPIDHLSASQDWPLLSEDESLFSVTDTFNLILHVSKTSVLPSEMGSSGPMDARIHPLLKGSSKDGREVAAPAVAIEHINGRFKGGRWLFFNQTMDRHFWHERGAKAIEKWAMFASQGVTDIVLKTNYASYEPGERPDILIQFERFNTKPCQWRFDLLIEKDGNPLEETTLTANISNQLAVQNYLPEITVSPGFYRITCTARSEAGEKRILHQGFWGSDRKLLAEGEALTCGRDYFYKNGRPFPVVGMTYMTSDVARYYLFLPNPYLWEKDFQQMKKAGINLIRTGIWTAWQHMMFIDGHFREDILRAIDAFILCAKKHDLEVTFTFFSFTPEMWQGENPYLDPRSIEAQKRFILSIVNRHMQTTNVQWDLINEPSLFNPAQTFSGPRTLGDRFDRESYIEWLKKRHGSVRVLQERWNMTPEELPDFNAAVPPQSSEVNFDIQDMISGKKGLKWLDYTLYTMAVHNHWAQTLSSLIKRGAPSQLVTVGQDEALVGQRPSPLFYGKAVDYTTNHSWWYMDQLLWDGIFAKTGDKPNLIQETGIMYVENPNNKAKRSEAELRNILERKYAYAFSTGGAGAVQWLWNTNYYMNNINESNIGAVRADGTEKPEAEVSYDFGRFFKGIEDLFTDRQLEKIAVIFPYSNDFSNRRLAFDATTKLTRVLGYELNQPFRAVSEYHLNDLDEETPELIIVPSAHNFDTESFQYLLDVVEVKGCHLLFTGPVGLDAYWHHTSRCEGLFGQTCMENVLREEILTIDGESYPVSFGERRIAQLLKEVPAGGTSCDLHEAAHGKGKIIWSSLPLELNDRIDVMKAVYQYAIEAAGIESDFDWLEGDSPGVYGRKLSYSNGSLFVFISEYSCDQSIKIKDSQTNITYSFLLEKERSLLFAVDGEGKLLRVYRDAEVLLGV